MTEQASEIKARIADDLKAAMKAGDRDRLAVLRLVMAALKQKEVDERTHLDDSQVLAVLDKLVKQRRESIKQYRDAGRDDLADKEAAEIGVIETYLPAQLSDEEIGSLVDEAVADTGASSVRDMGKVMNALRPKVQGRADMGKVSAMVKNKLQG